MFGDISYCHTTAKERLKPILAADDTRVSATAVWFAWFRKHRFCDNNSIYSLTQDFIEFGKK